MGNLDKKSSIPYYVQIKEDLLERIRDATYRPGQRIPSEQALAEEYQVTRTTVRKALDEMKREGVIRTEKGKGSVGSNSRIEQSLLQFYSFGREIGTTGEAAASRVIKVGRFPPPSSWRRCSGFPPTERYTKSCACATTATRRSSWSFPHRAHHPRGQGDLQH